MERRRAIGYIRVSTTAQAEEGVSLAAQRDRLAAWAVARDHCLLGIEEDAGVSGGRADNRPGLQRAIERACRERAVVIVYSLSRLARSTRDAILIAERLEKNGADLVSLTESIDTSTAAGKLFYRVMSALSEFEADVVSERTVMALRHLRQQGRVSGTLPFGFMAHEGRVVPHPEEQRVVTRVHELRAAGVSLRGVCRELTAEGYRPRGNAWRLGTVASIARSRRAAA